MTCGACGVEPEDVPEAPAPVDPFARVADVIPVGGVPLGMVGVVEYLDPDGHSSYCVLHIGDLPLSTFVGLMELGKVKLVEHFERGS